MHRIYFDHNATTPLAPEVAAAMRPFLDEPYGNPSSLHWAGERSRPAIERARRQTAALLRCEPHEVVFTSGGTEADNFALTGLFFSHRGTTPPHFVVSAFEHPAIANTCEFLERLGAGVTRVPVDRLGLVDPDDVRRALRPATVLVSVMHSNNEVGTLQPIREIAAAVRPRGVLVHTDAAQSVGKVPIDVGELGVDLLTVAGHKMYAPQGVGALYVRSGVVLEPLMHGAGHERGLRAGTENVLEIVGLGAACEPAEQRMNVVAATQLRDAFWQSLQARFGDRVVLNGHPTQRLPNTLNVGFVDRLGSEILAMLPEVAASTGSACHAGEQRASPVLTAMGVSPHVALGAIRFSLGRNSTAAEVETVVDRLAAVVK